MQNYALCQPLFFNTVQHTFVPRNAPRNICVAIHLNGLRFTLLLAQLRATIIGLNALEQHTCLMSPPLRAVCLAFFRLSVPLVDNHNYVTSI